MQLRQRRPGESSYRLLTQLLREQIHRDEYPEGQALPTELALVREHGLSRQTVRRAYQDLAAEGLIFRVRGRGTFVTPHSTRYRRSFGSIDDLMNLQLDTDFELVRPLVVEVDIDAARRLHLEDPLVHSVTFLRQHDGEAFCRTQVYLPPAIGKSLDQVRELTDPGARTRLTVIALIESHGHDIVDAEQLITAKAADGDLPADLRCAPGTPVLHIERTYLDRKGEPLEYAVSDFLPEYYSHHSRLGRSVPAGEAGSTVHSEAGSNSHSGADGAGEAG